MELVTRIAEVIVPVFLIVAIGYAYARRVHPDMGAFNRIVLDVLTPVIVYTALAGKEFRLQENLPLLGAGALLILLTGLVAWGVARAAHTSPRTLVPVVMFTNCGNMGLPLALFAFGPQGLGAAVALFSISNLIHFSVGSRITSAGASTRELLLSPLMIASALGFASAATGVRPPDMLFSGLKLLGEAMVPLMLFALGVRLTQLRRRDVPRGLLGAFARPLVGLGVAVPLAWALGLEGTARAQLILFAALPPAVMQYLLAERYGQEPERVAAMILLGNALAVLSVPVGLALAF
ncbi:AEC family transporter [Ramlibacter sp. USB13]|uniref:AEC family transporter n=1 Tax=Ramlibacter cellulosilyticus TaxID=2764187 RepID=A0A923MY37_9BURK|nr:AEC family transporter [Ramlibacter cellulosilyticus]MBC5785827.1 AEC family transporter [Ramlibacter cellulosilyticus]